MSKKYLTLLGAAMGMGLSVMNSGKVFSEPETPRVKRFSDKAKLLSREHKELRWFTIHGHKVQAYSYKDGLQRLIYQGKIKRKKKK